MISGYVMLDKKVCYKKTLVSCLKTMSVIIIFSSIYYWTFNENLEKGIFDYFETIYTRNITNTYWYLYLYLGLVLMMPFLNKMTKEFSKKDFYVFFLISAIVNMVFPVMIHYFPKLKYTGLFQVPIFGEYISMLLWGLYVKRYRFDHKKIRIICPIIFALSIIMNVALTYREYIINDGQDYLFLDNRGFILIVLPAAVSFLFWSTFSINGKLATIIKYIGSMTFGIYLISDFLIRKFNYFYSDYLLKAMPALIAMIVFELFIFIAGGIFAIVIKKIPLIKQLV